MTAGRLLLTSLGMGALPGVVGPTEGVRVAFLATAAEPYDAAPWVEEDRRRLAGLGFAVRDLDLDRFEALDDADVLYVAGGNTFWLLHRVRASGLDALLPGRVDAGLLYVGASAGAVIAGPDIAPIAGMDDPAAAPGLASTAGLGLTDVVVLPHLGGSLAGPAFFREAADRYGDRYRLLPITDAQAVLVEGGGHRVVDSP